jgi:protein-S-isoprenylcysteine O-methyltransferase Ste14
MDEAIMRIWHRKADIAAALFWALLASMRVALFLAEPSLLQAGHVAFSLVIVALFVLRRPATIQGSPATFWLAAIATLGPVLAFRPAETGWPTLGLVVQQVGLVLTLVAILTLRRSFGLAPAHRGLVMHGVYGVVRHPLYFAEFVALVGYCIGYASVLNWTVLSVSAALQVMRLLAEERLLSADADYVAYRQRVRWRLVPGVW